MVEGEELARLWFLLSHKELSPKGSRPKTSREAPFPLSRPGRLYAKPLQ